jgi:hypothetical protein
MFAGLRRFQKIIWVVAAVVIIPTFVVFFSPSSMRGVPDEDRLQLGSIDGKPISRTQFLEARSEAMLRMFITSGRWPENEGDRLTDYTYSWLVVISQLQEQGIKADDRAMGRLAASYGITDIDAFLKNISSRQRGIHLTKEDFVRYLEHEVGFQQLVQLAGVSGQLVHPREAQEKFLKEHQENVVEAVFFQTSSYTNGVVANAAELGRYYTNMMAQYRLPERLKVAYVEFPKSNYFAQADSVLALRTNLSALIDQEYQQRGATNYTDPNNPAVVLGEKEAKDQIRSLVRGQSALTFAHNAATELADKLMGQSDASVQTFESFMAAAKQTVKVSSPFTRDEAPAEMKSVSPEFAGRLFELTNSASVVLFQPMMGEDAVYIAAVKQRIPSQIEPFEAVRARVAADYLRSQGRERAVKAGNSFHSNSVQQVSAGKSFAEVAAKSGLRVEALPPFSSATENLPELAGRLQMAQLNNAVSSLTNGGISRFMFTQEGGVVLHLKDRKALSEEIQKEKYPAFLRSERMSGSFEAFGKWIGKIEQAKLQRPAPAAGAADGQGASAAQ